MHGYQNLQKNYPFVNREMLQLFYGNFDNRRLAQIEVFHLYHKDLEKQGNLRACFALLTVTQLWLSDSIMTQS